MSCSLCDCPRSLTWLAALGSLLVAACESGSPADAGVADASSDAARDAADARVRRDAALPDAAYDTPAELPRTGPCEPRRAPILCNPLRIEDDCGAFGETCTHASSACVTRRPEGALCRSSVECQDGLVCSGTISYGLCVPTPGEGAPCTGTCLEPDRLFCDLDASPPTCAARRGAGGSCSVGPNACADGFYCTTDAVCAEFGEVGAPCTSFAACAVGLTCAEGLCAPAPTRGEACPEGVCAAGLFCSFSEFPPACVPRIAEGAPCGFSDLCVEGTGCYFDPKFTSGICATPTPIGEACSSARDTCAPGSRCEGDVCVARLAPEAEVGAPCGSSACEPTAFCANLPAEAGVCWSSACEGGL